MYRPRAGRRGSVQRSRRLWIEGPTLRQRRLPWWGVVLTARAAARLSCTTPHRKHPASFPRPELFLLVVSANQPCVGQACRAVAGRHLKPRRLRHALRRCVRIPQPSIFILFQPSARVHPSFLLGAQPFTRTERCSRSAETATPSRGWSHRSAPSPAFHGL